MVWEAFDKPASPLGVSGLGAWLRGERGVRKSEKKGVVFLSLGVKTSRKLLLDVFI